MDKLGREARLGRLISDWQQEAYALGVESCRAHHPRTDYPRIDDFAEALAWISDYAGSGDVDVNHPLWTDTRITENEASTLYDLLAERPWRKGPQRAETAAPGETMNTKERGSES